MDTNINQYNANGQLKKGAIEAAAWWLARDFFLLPVQPFSKKLVPKFGAHQDQIKDLDRAGRWFGENSLANIAVCGTQTSFILDFDDPGLYRTWASQFPEAARTYTETTPRGGCHVFGHCYQADLQGVQLVPGVELKRVVLVAPSKIGDRFYTRGQGDLLELDAKLLLSPLSKTPIVTPSRVAQQPMTGSLLEMIKARYSCLDLLGVTVTSAKRFIPVTCPFHEDHEASAWVDQTRNLWGCHACGIRGDVINLYARLHGLTVQEAIREMGKRL